MSCGIFQPSAGCLCRLACACACALALACATAQAATRTWQNGSGTVTDASHWGGTLPTAGDVASFNQAATYTVTFPNGSYANAAQFAFNARSGQTLTVNGLSTTFFQSTLDESSGSYNKEPIQNMFEGAKVFDQENYWGGTVQTGPFKLTNFSWRQICGANNGPAELHFDRGTYNFYDPEGTATAFRHVMFQRAPAREQRIYVHSGATLRLPGLAWVGNGRHNLLRYEGGVHSMNGVLNFNYSNLNESSTTNRLEVADGAVLTMNATQSGGTGVNFSGDTFAKRRFELDASGAGTRFIVTGTGWNDSQGGISRYRVADGATFESASSGTLRFGNATATHHDVEFLMTNATLKTLSGTMAFGGASGQPVTFRTVDTTLDLGAGIRFDTKATGFVTGGSATGRFSLLGGTLTLADSQLTTTGSVSYLKSSGLLTLQDTAFLQNAYIQTGDGMLSVSGGSWTSAGNLIERWDGTVEGGTLFRVALSGATVDWRSTHFLNNASIAFENTTGFVSNIVVGTAANAPSAQNVWTISGGSITNRGWFIVGQNRPGTVKITGGTHRFLGGNDTNGSIKGSDDRVGKWTTNGTVGENSTGTFEISGADTDVDIPIDGMYFANNAGAVCNLRIGGGHFAIGTTTAGKSTFLASQNTAQLDFRQTGGAFEVRNAIACARGTIDWLQTGGAITAPSLMIAASQNGLATAPQTYELAGGTATFGAVAVCHNTSTLTPCTLKLTGGTLAANYVVGGGGAACRGGKGSATLIADGGTLVARQGQATFLQDFDTADIRGGGLVFETDFDITVAQDFTNLTASATSSIVKRGKGKLTLAGAIDPTVSIVVEEGTVGFARSETIAALTVGTSATPGAIALESGVSVLVSGAVTVVHDSTVQALVYTKDAQTGATLITIDGNPAQTLEIVLDAGTSNATANISYRPVDTLRARVASGADLTLSGAYSRGAFEKAGAGVATLVSKANLFNTGLTLLAGTLGAQTMEAFGCTCLLSPKLTQKGGTLNLPAGTVPFDYEADTGSATAAFVIRNDSDVTVSRAFANKNGALVKRGAGKLRFETPVTFTTGNGVNALTTTTVHAFDADGTPPTTGYAGFNIVEGEVELADASYTLNHSAFLGLRTVVAPTATPTLTITNATVSMNGSSYNIFCVGPCVKDDDPGQEFRLNILESTVTGGTVPSVGGISAATATSSKERVDVLVRDSVLAPTYAVYFNENRYSTAYWTIDNSQVLVGNAGGSRSYGRMVVNFINGSVYSMPDGELAYFPQVRNGGAGVGDCGFFRFSGGSKAYISRIGGQGGYFFCQLIFNGGYWYAGECPRLAYADGWLDNNRIKVILEEGGVTMPVEETCRNTIRLEGEGGLVKTGAGELVFDTRSTWEDWGSKKTAPTEWKVTEAKGGPATWCFTGPVAIEEGTVSVVNGAMATNAAPVVDIAGAATWRLGDGLVVSNATVSGAGTVEGGTLANLTIAGEWISTGRFKVVPTFTGRLTGVTCVDFGRTAADPFTRPYPKNVLVANVPGDASDTTWHAQGLGDGGLTGKFRTTGGKVYCDIEPNGFIMVIRRHRAQ